MKKRREAVEDRMYSVMELADWAAYPSYAKVSLSPLIDESYRFAGLPAVGPPD